MQEYVSKNDDILLERQIKNKTCDDETRKAMTRLGDEVGWKAKNKLELKLEL